MTRTQTAGIRKMAEILMDTTSAGFTLETWNDRENRWQVAMFDLTLARAYAYSAYYRKARILSGDGTIVRQ